MSDNFQEIHRTAIRQFDAIQMAEAPEREQCLLDRRFVTVTGAQWEGVLENGQQKPKLEINKIALTIMRYISEYRNNRITVVYQSKQGEQNDKTAEALTDLYRGIEQSSIAEEAYDNAFGEAISGGIGAFRIATEYEDDEDDEDECQKACLEPIYDADSCVFFDLSSKRQDKSDAKHCFVISAMTPDAFKEEYPKAAMIDVQKQVDSSIFDWFSVECVYVAEYYKVEKIKEQVVYFETPQGSKENYRQSELDEDADILVSLKARGFVKKKTKKITKQKVRKYIISGGEILEDCGHIAGKYIPIIPVYGIRAVVDGIERPRGHVRLAKDAQRLKNMQMGKLAEIAVTSPVRKPIVNAQAIQNHQLMWQQDNVMNYPYLLVDPVIDEQGNASSSILGYTEPYDVPNALAAIMQFTELDIKEILGNPQDAEKMVSNISGEAVERIQNQVGMNVYIYISNFAKAVRWAGEVFLHIAKDIYNEPNRKVKGIGDAGEQKTIELMKPMMNKGKFEYENDLSRVQCEVVATVGATSDSKRQSLRRDLMAMMQYVQDPETATVLQAQILANLEGEGLQDVRDYFRKKLLSIGAAKPTEEEIAAQEEAAKNQAPDPNAELMAAQTQMMAAQAKKLDADAGQSVAKIDNIQADTAKKISETDINNLNAKINVVEKINQGEQALAQMQQPMQEQEQMPPQGQEPQV